MDVLQEAAHAFQRLTNIEYNIIISKEPLPIRLFFESHHFSHLAGFQYLTDILNQFPSNSTAIFKACLNGDITYTDVSKSTHFHSKVKGRIDNLAYLEAIMDSDQQIFVYEMKSARKIDRKTGRHYQSQTRLQGRFLFQKDERIFLVNTMIDKDRPEIVTGRDYFCRSFFVSAPENNPAIGQRARKLVYKEKVDHIAKQKTILHNPYPLGHKQSVFLSPLPLSPSSLAPNLIEQQAEHGPADQ